MDIQQLSPEYQLELANQFASLSTFLGGFSATFLATLLFVNSQHRISGWTINAAAFAACSFIVSAIAAVALTLILHPHAPMSVEPGQSLLGLRLMAAMGFAFGVISLLLSVGSSGWLRDKKTGITTTSFAGIALLLVIFIFT